MWGLVRNSRHRERFRFGLCACAIAVLSACSSAFLPAQGPSAGALVGQATQNGAVEFDVVNVTNSVVDTLQAAPTQTFHSMFGNDGRPPEPRIAVGDSVAILIWEAGGAGLFEQSVTVNGIPSGSRPAEIPAQVVDRDGAITVPFGGRVVVAGRTPYEVETEIARVLARKASQPQVVVTVARSIANAVTVTGEVVKGSLVPLTPYGERLLDVIAAAGGSNAPIYETYVKLTRRGVTITMPLLALVNDPAENIYAWPRDVLTLVRTPRTFEAFGATGRQAEIPFEEQHVSLAQALAKSAGLLDLQADPSGVFLFRYEPRALARALTPAPLPDSGSTVPIVYHLDLSDVKNYFLAQRFVMQDDDIIYVASAEADQLQKFLSLLAQATSPVVNGIILKNEAQ